MPPPQPWDIAVQPCELFKNEDRQIEIPNTSHVEVIIFNFFTNYLHTTSINMFLEF